MKVELLTTQGCSNGARTAALLAEVLRELAPGTVVAEITVETPEEAARLGFPGSPTVRIDGRDIEPEAPTSTGLG
jgi:hypothetical protein